MIGYVQFPAISIGIAASIFGAQCIGAKREDLMNSVIRSAIGLNYAIGGAIILPRAAPRFPRIGGERALPARYYQATVRTQRLFGNSKASQDRGTETKRDAEPQGGRQVKTCPTNNHDLVVRPRKPQIL